MPSTVNGIGTHYYGKSNLETKGGICEFCHRGGELQSYDTRLWFVVVYIPFIPLGRKRILNYCPHCTRHRVLALAEWERLKRENITQAMAKFKAQPTSEAAIQLHATLLAFGQSGQATEFRTLMQDRFANDVKVQVYLGSVLEHLGKPAEAAEHFQRALNLDPSLPEAKIGAGLALARQGKLDEARKLMSFLEAPGSGQHSGPLFELAVAYQGANRHKEALELFQKLIEGLPQLAQDKHIRKFIRKSEAALGVQQSQLPPRKLNLKRLIGWSTAGLAIALILLGSNYYIARHRMLHVVSVFSQPISAEVPGYGSVKLANRGIDSITLPEGKHRVIIGGAVRQEVDFVIHSGFFERWFQNPVSILNVGGAAMLLWEETTYSVNPIQGVAHPFRVYYGEPFLHLPDVDYRFEAFPEKISTESSTIRKTRIGLLNAPPMGLFLTYAKKNQYDEAMKLAEWQMRLHPETADFLPGYVAMAKQAKRLPQARALISQALKRRPVEIEWHRAYQELLADEKYSGALATEYDAMVRQEPDDSALLYLRGRLCASQQEAMKFYEQAIAKDAKNAYAHNAIGFRKMSMGDWAGARPSIATACGLRPDERSFSAGFFNTRLALGEFDPLEKELRATLGQPSFEPGYGAALTELCDVLIAQNKDDEARRIVADYQRRAQAQLKEDAGSSVESLHRYLLYSLGDFAALEKRTATDKSEAGRTYFHHALVETGRLPEAEKVYPLNDRNATDPFHFLSVSLAWRQAGDSEKAAAWRGRAVELLLAGRAEYVQAAEFLKRNQAVQWAEVQDLALQAKLKAVLLVALAQRFPENSSELLRFARLLNVDRAYPYHLIRRLTQSAPAL
jgi:tetratricopeptide (TPR) repeat protein